jgi:hypothetical protein
MNLQLQIADTRNTWEPYPSCPDTAGLHVRGVPGNG